MKKIFHDIIPQEKRSIRNIPLTKKNGQNETYEANSIDSTFKSNNPMYTESKNTSSAKVSHSMDGIRPKTHAPNISNTDDNHSSEKKIYTAIKYSEAGIPDADEDEYIDESATKKQTEKKHVEIEPAFFEGSSKDFREDTFEEWNKHQKKLLLL